MNKTVTVAIPTFNGGALWHKVVDSLLKQKPFPVCVKVIDSSSIDDTVDVAKSANFEVGQIATEKFDHGGTRSKMLEGIETEFVVFLTQDSLLADIDSIAKLLEVFEEDEDVVCAYGRQLPHANATPLAQYARHHSYPSRSYIASLSSSYPKGFRKAFFSNAFAAYRVDFLRSIGGFPKQLILGEDSYVAAKAIISNKKVAYVADALVFHSHNYTIAQEFRRYFDIGVFHSSQPWIIEVLGRVEGEGLKFAAKQILHTLKEGELIWAVKSGLTSIAKYIGYKLGWQYRSLGIKWSRRFSMHKSYWKGLIK